MLANIALSFLALAPQDASAQPIRTLVVSGQNNHLWEWTTPSLAALLTESGKFAVEVTVDPVATLADPAALADVDLFVLDYNGPRWGEAAEAGFLAAVSNGAGVAAIHAANNAFTGWAEYERMIALLWRDGAGHGKFHAFDLDVVDRDHPITHDLPRIVAHPDELYHRQTRVFGDETRVLMEAHSSEESGGTGEREPLVVTNQYGQGRVFVDLLGHVWKGNDDLQVSYTDPQFADLLVRGCEWAATGAVTPPQREANALTAAEQRAGWESLFDGATGAGWVEFKQDAFPAAGWVVEDGALRVQAGAQVGDLVSERSFQDFEFAFDWKVAEGANSGIMYRVSDAGGATYSTGPEYQILDDENHGDGGNPSTSAASLYGLYVAEEKTLAPVGGWNTGRIVCIGNRVEHWLNGAKVVEAWISSDDWNERLAASKFADWEGFGTQREGRLALQNHGNDVWFRNLRVRDLTHPPTDEVALWNGRDFTGWTYHLNEEAELADVWSAAPEGHFVCAGRPIGYLRTEADWTNYVLRVEWRFDPEKGAGNSGVLMRMQAPDKVWPKSVEAQLHSGSAGDFWNIDEFTMTADPARTNGRNTKATRSNEKPLGEWNQYEILCCRGDIVLRVNGEILNQAWDCAEIPGKICLQSEGAEIHFKTVTLQELH